MLTAVIRRLWPCLTEATLVPTALCYAGLLVSGLTLGIAAAATWVYLMLVFRLVTRRTISGLLVLATAIEKKNRLARQPAMRHPPEVTSCFHTQRIEAAQVFVHLDRMHIGPPGPA